MDNTLVSARVPRAKKERASSVLSSIGATTSDLINSALDYVITNKELPGAARATERNFNEFEEFVGKTTLAVEWPEGFAGDYKSLMADMRRADYEALD